MLGIGVRRGANRGPQRRTMRTMAWSMGNVVIATIIGMITARILGVEFRGILALLLSVAGLSVLVGTLGTNVAIRRRFPQGETSAKQYLKVSAMLFIAFIVLLQFVARMLSIWVDPIFSHPEIIAVFSFYGIGYFWSNQLLDLLNAAGKIPLAAATNAVGTGVCLLGVCVVAWMQGGLVGVASAYSFSMLAQIVLASVLLRRALARPVDEREGSGRALIWDGVRLMGLNLGQAITYRADTIMIGALSTSYAVGIYAVATTPAAVLMLPATALGQVLMHDAALGKTTLRDVVRRVLLVEAGVGVVAVVGWVFADPVVLLLFGEQFGEAAGVFRVLLVAQLCLVPFLVLSRVLVGYGSTWTASLPSVLGAATLIVFGLIWIPELGAYGGAWASVVGYAGMSLTTGLQLIVFHLRRRRRVDLPLRGA